MIRWSLSLPLVALIGCASPGRTTVAPNDDLIALKQEIVALKDENATLRNRLGHLESEVLASKSEGEFTAMTIDSVSWSNDPSLHMSLGSSVKEPELLCHVVEWGGFGRMLRFTRKADHTFLLESPGHPSVHTQMGEGGICNTNGDIRFTILHGVNGQLEPGVEYTLRPRNQTEGYTWKVASDVRVTR